jgi:hypothetical protein
MINAAEFQRVRLILLHEWDPIGITRMRDYKEATEDEYDGYAREIAAMLGRGATASEILEYLKWAETRNMELPFSEVKARHAAELITQTS